MTQLMIHNGDQHLGTFDLENVSRLASELLGKNIRELFPAEATRSFWHPDLIHGAIQGVEVLYQDIKGLFRPTPLQAETDLIEAQQTQLLSKVADLQGELGGLKQFLLTAQENPGTTLTIQKPGTLQTPATPAAPALPETPEPEPAPTPEPAPEEPSAAPVSEPEPAPSAPAPAPTPEEDPAPAPVADPASDTVPAPAAPVSSEPEPTPEASPTPSEDPAPTKPTNVADETASAS